MNNTLHPPGPWNFKIQSGTHNQGLIISENDGRNIAAIYDSKDVHLISAAPELLSALETCVSELNQLAFIQKDKMAGDAIQKALDAIAKAKGAV